MESTVNPKDIFRNLKGLADVPLKNSISLRLHSLQAATPLDL